MSNTNFPGAIDTGPGNPTTLNTLATLPHHTQHGFANDAILALETKLGYGATLQSPVTSSFLVGSATGQSQWQTSPVSPSFTTSILDTNNKTWIGQTATASAVNYVNIANAATTNSPTISALGTDSNIGLNLVPKGSGKVQDNGTNLIDFRSSFTNFVSSNNIWTATSGLMASGTGGNLFINGIEYTTATVTNHTFTASSDTYIDYTVGTGITYTAVSNGAAAPSLAANSIRLAKVVTNGATVTSILQTGIDSLKNYIYPQVFVRTAADANGWTAYHWPNRIVYTSTDAASSVGISANTNSSALGPAISLPIGIIDSSYLNITATFLGGFGGRVVAGIDNGNVTTAVTGFTVYLGNLTTGSITVSGIVQLRAETIY